jgi:SAM-dependent methyltransferase
MSDAFRVFEQAGWTDPSIAMAYHRKVGELTSGCIPELLGSADVRPGDRVLDVACGAGYVAAAARQHGALATGVDFSLTQVQLAEQTYPDIRFVEGNAEALPFASGEFDVVLNAFGMPHVADPERVVAEARRVLKPGGRFAYASWGEYERCIAFSMIYDAIREHGALDVGLPAGPNFFGYGDAKYAHDLLDRAGFTSIAATEVPLRWRVADADMIMDAFASGTVRASAVLKRQDAVSSAKIRQYLRNRVVQFAEEGGYAVPAPVLVVAGHKS